ncbi:MAG: hypothetical protein AAGL49_02780 [Pseudomonadota bacterium]
MRRGLETVTVFQSAALAVLTLALALALAPGAALAASDRPSVAFAEFDLPVGEEGRMASVRLAYPVKGEDLLLVGFSHGANSDNGQYDRVAERLADAGYVVAIPTHVDSETNPDRDAFDQAAVMTTRLEDMMATLVAHEAVRAAAPELEDRLMDAPVAAAGHSYGALIAQIMGGARVMNGAVGARAPSVAAVLAISPPGPFPNFVSAESFATLETPMLVTTGTADILPGFIDDWRAHLLSHEAAPPGGQVALVSDGVDHYFGNVIGRLSLESPAQDAAFERAMDLSAAFLDAELRGRRAVWDGLKSEIDGETDHEILER